MLNKNIVSKIICVSIIILTIVFQPGKVNAQGDVQFSFGVNRVAHLGSLNYAFSATPGIFGAFARDISELSYLSIEVGFMYFQPRDTLFYYIIDEDDYGTVRYEPIYNIPFTADFVTGLFINDKLLLEGSIGIGYLLFYLEYEKISNTSIYIPTTIGRGSMRFGSGIYYLVNDHISLGVISRFTMHFPLGNFEQQNSAYSPGAPVGIGDVPDLALVNFYFSSGVKINFIF